MLVCSANATETNKNKLKVLQAAASQVEQTFEAAYDALSDVSKGGAYGELLKALLAQVRAALATVLPPHAPC